MRGQKGINPAKRYHGQPCVMGHTEKYKSNNLCVQCDRLKKAAQRLANKRPPKPRGKNFPDRPKSCGTCKVVKEPSEYYKTKRGYLYTDCIPCYLAYQADMYRLKRKPLGKKLDSVLGGPELIDRSGR